MWCTQMIAWLLALLIPLTGCEKSPEDARRELGQMNVQYTQEAFVEAAKNGDTLAVELFLAAGMSPDARDEDGQTALRWAVAKGHTDIVQRLLDRGADINEDGGRALVLAAALGHTNIVKALLSKDADVDAQIKAGGLAGGTALMLAADMGYTDIVKVLLSQGASVNMKSRTGKTALSLAKGQGHTEIVQLLKQAGAKE